MESSGGGGNKSSKPVAPSEVVRIPPVNGNPIGQLLDLVARGAFDPVIGALKSGGIGTFSSGPLLEFRALGGILRSMDSFHGDMALFCRWDSMAMERNGLPWSRRGRPAGWEMTCGGFVHLNVAFTRRRRHGSHVASCQMDQTAADYRVCRRQRHVTVVVGDNVERLSVVRAAKPLVDVSMTVLLEREAVRDWDILQQAIVRSDALVFRPLSKRKRRKRTGQVAERLLAPVEHCYDRLSVCLFVPDMGMDFLRLNKLENFNAKRILRGRVMESDGNDDDVEAATKTLQRLPEMLSYVSPVAAASVSLYTHLMQMWESFSEAELMVALQLIECNLPLNEEITEEDVETHVRQMMESLGRRPAEKDFIEGGIWYMYEAIATSFGGIDRICDVVAAQQEADVREAGAKLRLKVLSELETSLQDFRRGLRMEDSGVLPGWLEMRRAGRTDLADLVQSCGGFESVARDVGLVYVDRCISKRYPSLDSLQREVRLFVEQRALELDSQQFELGRQYMPRYVDFRNAGRDDLVQGIKAYGGIRLLAKEMNLHLHYHATHDYEGDFEGLREALLTFREVEMNNEAYMPTIAMLRDKGRLDIIAGLKHHGGMVYVANRLQLKLQTGRKVQGAKERDLVWLQSQLKQMRRGGSESLPTTQELLNDGRVDLVRAIKRHGGREKVAWMCGLTSELDGTLLSEDFGQLDICECQQALEHNARSENRGVADLDGSQIHDGLRRPPHYFRGDEHAPFLCMQLAVADPVPEEQPA